MKLFSLLLLTVLFFGSSSSKKKSSINFTEIIKKKAERGLIAFFNMSQKNTTDAIERVFAKATSSRWKIAKIWTSNCQRYRKSEVYCGFIDALRNSSREGVEAFDKITQTKENITKEALNDYVADVQAFLTEKMLMLDIQTEKLSCYAAEAGPVFQTKNETMDAGKEMFERFTNETQIEFVERMDGYRMSIIEYTDSITSNYVKCLKEAAVVKICLESFAETQTKLPFIVKNMMDEIKELVMDRYSLVGPDVNEIRDLVAEFDEDLEVVIEKCNSMPDKETQ